MKHRKSLPFLASIAGPQQHPGAGTEVGAEASVPDIDGENVRPIAILLTQVSCMLGCLV
jgi:hypothetical protein